MDRDEILAWLERRGTKRAERYWTIVSEFEVASLAEFEKMMSGEGQDAEAMKEFDVLMKGYHDLVENGRREIYKIEG